MSSVMVSSPYRPESNSRNDDIQANFTRAKDFWVDISIKTSKKTTEFECKVKFWKGRERRGRFYNLYRPLQEHDTDGGEDKSVKDGEAEEIPPETTPPRPYLFMLLVFLAMALSVVVPYGVYQATMYLWPEDECACFQGGIINYLFNSPKPVRWLDSFRLFAKCFKNKFYF